MESLLHVSETPPPPCFNLQPQQQIPPPPPPCFNLQPQEQYPSPPPCFNLQPQEQNLMDDVMKLSESICSFDSPFLSQADEEIKLIDEMVSSPFSTDAFITTPPPTSPPCEMMVMEPINEMEEGRGLNASDPLPDHDEKEHEHQHDQTYLAGDDGYVLVDFTKNSLEENQQLHQSSCAASVPEKKRGRGRPRKTDAPSGGVESGMKNRRSKCRPKILATPCLMGVIEKGTSSSSQKRQQLKKRRGRPRNKIDTYQKIFAAEENHRRTVLEAELELYPYPPGMQPLEEGIGEQRNIIVDLVRTDTMPPQDLPEVI